MALITKSQFIISEVTSINVDFFKAAAITSASPVNNLSLLKFSIVSKETPGDQLRK